MNDKVTNLLRLLQELHDGLTKKADKKNISFASLIRLICSEYLDEAESK